MNFIIATASAVGALGVIIGAIIAVYRIVKRVDDAIGKDSAGRTISDRLDRVEHQLWENGGSSLADRVNKMNAVATETAAQVEVIREMMLVVVGNKTKK